VKIDQQQALTWSHEEVINRYTELYKPSPIIDRYLKGNKLKKAETVLSGKISRNGTIGFRISVGLCA
jgi:hypothetical protein